MNSANEIRTELWNSLQPGQQGKKNDGNDGIEEKKEKQKCILSSLRYEGNFPLTPKLTESKTLWT